MFYLRPFNLLTVGKAHGNSTNDERLAIHEFCILFQSNQ